MDDTARLVWKPIQLATLMAAAFALKHLGWQPATALVTVVGAGLGAAIGVSRVHYRRRGPAALPTES